MAVTVWAAILAVAACATPASPPVAPATRPAVLVTAAPVWRPGDRWEYAWRSGAEAATRSIEVLEIKEINGLSYYLLRAGDLEHLWTPELGWAGSVRNQRIEARMTPPTPLFVWPLEPGRRWQHRGTYEDRSGRKPVRDSFLVVGVETVEVPAGRFQAFKVVRETDSRDSDQYWYAPEVGFYVKWAGRRGDVEFEEELRAYHRAPRLIPDSRPEVPSRTP